MSSIFKELIDKNLQEEVNSTVILNYEGEFHQDLIHRMLEQLNERIISTGDNRKVAGKVFSVLYELMNNIQFHALPINGKESIGFVLLQRNNSHYQIKAGNLIKRSSELSIISAVSEINAMDEVLLVEEHTRRMKDGLKKGRVGEGLGFVQLKKMLNEPLSISFFNQDEHTAIYTVSCAVSRV